MNILFLTIGKMESIESHTLYPDLLRQFRDNGHSVYVVSPREKRTGLDTEVVEEKGAKLLYVKIGNLTKCGIVEKGISTVAIEKKFKTAITGNFPGIRFDLVIYSTPPITLSGVVDFIKKRDHARTYLLLKDIFPQNAVDLGMIQKNGIKGLLYQYFRRKEKQLYSLSDYIGCMSQANVAYVLKHNPEVDSRKVEVCPNSVEPVDMSVSDEEKKLMREKYGIPQDKTVFVYGGNLGKPQGIPFLIKCLESQKDNPNVFFLIAGDGTEFSKLDKFVKTSNQSNVKLMNRLPKEDYDCMVGSCDVGMIFLDHRFTIPNFPSRLLSYMQAKLPVLAVTDPNTDIGKVIIEGGFGWWCESNAVKAFHEVIDIAYCSNRKKMGETGYQYMKENYSATKGYEILMRHLE